MDPVNAICPSSSMPPAGWGGSGEQGSGMAQAILLECYIPRTGSKPITSEVPSLNVQDTDFRFAAFCQLDRVSSPFPPRP